MAWFPWARLPVRSNMSATELIDWLRYRAIDFGAPSAFVEAIDDLHALDDGSVEKLTELLENLVGAAKCFLDDPDAKEGLEEALTAANEVL